MQSSQVKATRTFDDKSIEIYWIIGQKTWETRGDAMPVIRVVRRLPTELQAYSLPHCIGLSRLVSQGWSLKHHIGESSSAAPKKRSDAVRAADIDIRKTLFKHKKTPKPEDRFIYRTHYLMSFSILPIRCTTSGSRSSFMT